ncbi:Hermansky-Pudlak syndrome 3 protein [Neodiprion fabricii]|uniref:Hermansky-Pudlak syndrome 3 protein n=1 Tax=Neodiprion fabricii TaxID=2872261 RepID=UPI001ED8C728|nr:Hermansky-Pudlak syndrome 3 protein [Neodiprion fabricii]
MVRVIPVHNFLSQNVATIEEPTASCVACNLHGELLLLALPTHCVEVHDLKTSDLKLLTVFPTVDLVCQILHCTTGDYVATLESKISRDGLTTSYFVRVYVNWALVESQGHAMRARIAGRVTPSLNRPMNSLEMIELPLNGQPTVIACCQMTGNLLVAIGCSAILHEFKVETQQTSKLKFIDFEARPWSLGFSFSPTRMEITEDFICILNSTHFLAFRLTNPMYDDIDQLSSIASTNSSSVDKTSISTNFSSLDKTEKTSSSGQQDSSPRSIENLNFKTTYRGHEQSGAVSLDLNSLVTSDSRLKLSPRDSTKVNVDQNLNNNKLLRSRLGPNKVRSKIISNPYIDWERLVCNEHNELQRLASRGIVETNSLPFTVNLPSISLERASPGHTLNPFILNPSNMDVVIKTTSPDDGWSENYAVKNLLRIKISNQPKNSNYDGESEIFTCLELKPLYLKRECNSLCLKKSILRSDKFKYLHGITCIICTTQEGYVYHFAATNCEDSNPTCLTTYPFTAPVRHIALENTVLHALTEAGLESYTLRLSHHIARSLNYIDNYKISCPSVSEPVCLIGLHPFLGMQNLLHTSSCLVLLARAENSWTLYSLNLPSSENLYLDFLNTAKHHKNSSPITYRHLLGEAHTILRLSKEVKRFTGTSITDTSNISQDVPDSRIESLYSQSCALLGDFYVNSDLQTEWELSIPYYRMSQIRTAEIISRKSTANAPGLVRYLSESLANMRSGPEADALFQTHNVVDLLSSESVEELSILILRSSILREYATDKLINVLSKQVSSDCARLATVLLYLQSEKQEVAKEVLAPISEVFVEKMVLEHWHLLFDSTALKKRSRAVPTFSEFSGILMQLKTRIFAEVLTQLIDDGILTLHQVVQVFLEYLPSRVGRDGHDAAAALQLFIETYFQCFYGDKSLERSCCSITETANDFAIAEAFRILVRSYLGNLTQSKVYKTVENITDCNQNEEKAYLFANKRPLYLNKLPPYSTECKRVQRHEEINNTCDVIKSIRSEVPKLQALLASGYLPAECIREVKQFLETQEIEGHLALKSLCITDNEIVTRMLMIEYPQAVLQYAKDKYTKETEWKCLIQLLQNEISMLDEGQESQQCFFDQIMKDTLTYLAQTLPLDELCRVLPKEDEAAYKRYTDACRRAGHADHVKSLIVATGHQLLATLNL